MFLLSDGRCNEAEFLFVEAIKSDERLLDTEHPDTLTIIGNIASISYTRARDARRRPKTIFIILKS